MKRRSNFYERIFSTIIIPLAIFGLTTGVYFVMRGFEFKSQLDDFISPVQPDVFPDPIILILLIAPLLSLMLVLILKYLKSDSPSSSSQRYSELESEIQEIKDSISKFKKTLETEDLKLLSENDKSNLVSILENRLENEALDSYRKKLEDSVITKVYETNVDDIKLDISLRLTEEIKTLVKRSNLNLAFGIIISLVGLLMLGGFILNLPKYESIEQTGFYFLTRLSLIIVIEFFAYFFLKLYKHNLGEIKYFQNEMTNIESRLLALELAKQSGDIGSLKDVIADLTKTERNFVLSKNQTTVELEKLKVDSQTQTNLVTLLKEFLKREK